MLGAIGPISPIHNLQGKSIKLPILGKASSQPVEKEKTSLKIKNLKLGSLDQIEEANYKFNSQPQHTRYNSSEMN